MKWFVGLTVLLACMASPAARADDCSRPKTIDDIKGLVSGLGYDVTPENALLRITVNSNYNYPVYFSVSKDGANLIVYTNLETVPDEKMDKMPAIEILKFNDTHFDYLALNKHEGKYRLAMEFVMPPGGATPQVLRSTINRLIDDANASENLWSPSKW